MVCEAEFVEREYRSAVGSDLVEADLGGGEGEEEEDEEWEEEMAIR